MTNEVKNPPTIWEKLFGRGTWVYILVAGIILLILAFKGFETFLSESQSYLIGFLGFMLCFIAMGIGIQYLSNTLVGDREKEIISGKAEPEGFLSASLTALLMLIVGLALMISAWATFDTALPEGVSMMMGVIGFFLAFFSFHHFAHGVFAAILRPLWKMKWFQYFAKMLLLVFAGFVLYNSYLSLQD